MHNKGKIFCKNNVSTRHLQVFITLRHTKTSSKEIGIPLLVMHIYIYMYLYMYICTHTKHTRALQLFVHPTRNATG